MKSRFVVLMVFLFMLSTITVYAENRCSDSDNGLNYLTVGGISTNASGQMTMVDSDHCWTSRYGQDFAAAECSGSDCNILEFFCTSTNTVGTSSKSSTEMGYLGCSSGAFYSCSDGKNNHRETDIDCGGNECTSCGLNKRCNLNTDCASANCDRGYCKEASTSSSTTTTPSSDTSSGIPSTCSNRAKDGDETGIDCGGSCPEYCKWNPPASDSSGACRFHCDKYISSDPRYFNWCKDVCDGKRSRGETCIDGIKNNGESDVDCGGSYCPLCANDKTCTVSTDCSGSVCENRICKNSSATETNTGTSAASTTCIDSDGGEDYFVKGTATGYNSQNNEVLTWADHCTDSSGRSMNDGPLLYEVVCENNEVKYKYDIRCENGCHLGACVRGSGSGTSSAGRSDSARGANDNVPAPAAAANKCDNGNYCCDPYTWTVRLCQDGTYINANFEDYCKVKYEAEVVPTEDRATAVPVTPVKDCLAGEFYCSPAMRNEYFASECKDNEWETADVDAQCRCTVEGKYTCTKNVASVCEDGRWKSAFKTAGSEEDRATYNEYCAKAKESWFNVFLRLFRRE